MLFVRAQRTSELVQRGGQKQGPTLVKLPYPFHIRCSANEENRSWLNLPINSQLLKDKPAPSTALL